ncbi:4282_t:CDS:2 [Rhizophagus irregularis]|nr:4282_t:CDS:2 [Rhizophagus irregularis]
MFYVFSLSNNQGDTSEDEDYKNYLDKRNDKRYYGKSENEIIWEALCSYSDPKLIEKIESDFKLLKITKILMMMLIKHGGGTQKIRQIQLPFTAKPGTLPLSSLKALTREYLKEEEMEDPSN